MVDKEQIVAWLKTRTKDDIVFVKKNPDITIFAKHPGMSRYDAERLVEDPDKIISVETSVSHDDRLVIIRTYSHRYDTEYIIIDPFNKDIEKRFKEKVAIITYFPIKRRRES